MTLRYSFFTACILLTNMIQAQLFESQMTNMNPAYTGMQDERFADFYLSAFPLGRDFNSLYGTASYQQNLDKINSGLGVTFGHSRINVEDQKVRSFQTAFSYRYAYRFENGLRLSGGARFGYFQNRLTNISDPNTLHGFIFAAGAMASYKNYTFGFNLPTQGDGFLNIAINGSYRKQLNDRIELTALSNTYLGGTLFQQTLTTKAEFNEKFWLATRFILVNNRDFYQSLFSSGLYFGYRFKQKFHVYGGTDFGFSSSSFSLYNTGIGLAYQLKGN